MAVKDANSKKDWSRAEQYYYQAVDVFPEGDASTLPPWDQPAALVSSLKYIHVIITTYLFCKEQCLCRR